MSAIGAISMPVLRLLNDPEVEALHDMWNKKAPNVTIVDCAILVLLMRSALFAHGSLVLMETPDPEMPT